MRKRAAVELEIRDVVDDDLVRRRDRPRLEAIRLESVAMTRIRRLRRAPLALVVASRASVRRGRRRPQRQTRIS